MVQDTDCAVLEMIYESYSDTTNMNNSQIKKGFRDLYETMNGKSLEECDLIINPVCALCREHERNGFINGLKVGVQLKRELNSECTLTKGDAMTVSLAEFKTYLDRYMDMAKVADVKIVSGDQNMIWLLRGTDAVDIPVDGNEAVHIQSGVML